MYIIFADGKQFDLITAKGKNEIVSSPEDMITAADRLTLELRFDSTKVDMEDLKPYFLNPDEKTSVIVLIDDNEEAFTHVDYVIRLKFSLEYVDGNSNPYIIMKLAKLNETDKALREVAGKVKVYTGTELQIAIAKKLDEVSEACHTKIESGIDVGEHHYSLTQTDQTNIGTWLNFVNLGFDAVPYHADGEWCTIYDAETFKTIAFTAITFIVDNTTYCNMLMRWIETLTDIDVINAVVYGETPLTGEYLENYQNIMSNLPYQDLIQPQSTGETPVEDETVTENTESTENVTE